MNTLILTGAYNLDLKDNEVTDWAFRTTPSKFPLSGLYPNGKEVYKPTSPMAKSNSDYELEIKIDMMRVYDLETQVLDVRVDEYDDSGEADRDKALDYRATNLIPSWANTRYQDNPENWYHFIEVSAQRADQEVRTITFPNARIISYMEEFKAEEAVWTATIVVGQKMDMTDRILVNGEALAAVMPMEFSSSDEMPLRQHREIVRGTTFKLSRERYRRINQVPITTGGNASNSGISRNKEFNGDFVTFMIDQNDIPIQSRALSNGVFQHPYGGNQDWFDDTHMAATGCGSIAASNVLFYYAQTQLRLGALARNSRYGPFTGWQHFRDYAADMYNSYTLQTINIPAYIADTFNIPPSFGIWFIDSVASGTVRFARSQGVTLTFSVITNRNETYEQAVNFIRTALENDNPVILLVTGNDYISRANVLMSELHFVTITAMTEIREIEISTNFEGNEVFRRNLGVVDYEIRTSDWGLRRFIPSLRQMWESNTTLAETVPRALAAEGIDMPPILIDAAISIFRLTPLASVSLASFTPGAVRWIPPSDGSENIRQNWV